MVLFELGLFKGLITPSLTMLYVSLPNMGMSTTRNVHEPGNVAVGPMISVL